MNGDLILRDAAIALIENFQRELCPVGMYGRHAVYGTDRDKFDDWQFIIDELEMIPTVDAAPVRHGRWIEPVPGDGFPYCSNCKNIALNKGLFLNPKLMEWNLTPYCPSCGAKMDGGNNDAEQ